ncbi:hypothetical protein GJAV_G00018960 [Gymnothorax javanicus]|nr:hypothetical protein GJAV_G00018960 [Gymnothorax javanicus]
MGPALLCLLLSLILLGVAVGGFAEEDEYTWPHEKVPLVRDKRTVLLSTPGFTAETQRELRGACGIECQSRLPRPAWLTWRTCCRSRRCMRTAHAHSLRFPCGTWRRQQREEQGTRGETPPPVSSAATGGRCMERTAASL